MMKKFDLMKEKISKSLKNGVMYATWYGISNPFGGSSFTTTAGAIGKATKLLNLAIAASGLIAACIIVYGAYLLILSAGDSDKAQKGQDTITSGIVGLIIVFLAKLIIQFIIDKLF